MQFGGDVGANDVFYAYPCGLYFAGLSRGPGQRVVVMVVVRAVALGGGSLRKQQSARKVAYLDELRHFSPLLLDLCAVLLLYHAQSRYGQLELYLQLSLPRISLLVLHRYREPIQLMKPKAPSFLGWMQVSSAVFFGARRAWGVVGGRGVG